MATLWFCLATILIAGYALLDGFDLGAGIVQLFVARTEHEKSQVLHSIGPVWDGNEVWLLAVGGTLFFAFPVLYASAFSGFYLSLMIVLWLLILPGISIEFRHHIDSPLWRPLWSNVFGLASAALALVFGVALGNVVRGVPLDQSGYFFLPFWTNLSPSGKVGHHRLVHAPCGDNVLPRLSSARQLVGGVEDRRELPGSNTLVRRKMLGGLSRDHAADVGRELSNPAKSDEAVSEPPLRSPIFGAGRHGHDPNARAQFPAAGSAGISRIRSISGWNVDECSLRSVSERAAGEYCAGFESHDPQCSHR
jgi:hypothetical protein